MDFQIIQKILDTFFDKSRSLISKLLIFSSFCLVFILIDDYFKFSYNFKINSQIEQVSKIENIVKDNKDKVLVTELKQIEKTIIDTRTKSDYLTSLFSSLGDLIGRNSVNAAKNLSNSTILHYLTSNWLLIFFVFWIFKWLRRYILTKIIWWVLAAGMLIVVFFWINGILTATIIPNETNDYLKLFLNMVVHGILGLSVYALFTIYGKSEAKSEDKKTAKKDIVAKQVPDKKDTE